MSQFLKLMPDQNDLNSPLDEEDLEMETQFGPSAASILGSREER